MSAGLFIIAYTSMCTTVCNVQKWRRMVSTDGSKPFCLIRRNVNWEVRRIWKRIFIANMVIFSTLVFFLLRDDFFANFKQENIFFDFVVG